MTSIGNIAFSGCMALLEVHFEGNAPELAGDYVFFDTPENLTITINEDATGFEGNVWDNMNVVVMKRPVVEDPDEDKSAEPEKEPEDTSSGKSNVVNTDTSSEKSNVVNTGDSANVMLWAVAAVLSMAAIIMVRRKQKSSVSVNQSDGLFYGKQ